MFLLAFAFAPSRLLALPPPPPPLFFTLISPTAGQVLHPGQKFKVEWKTLGLNAINCTYCEMELWLSLDGGRTYTMQITPSMDPRATFFYWVVPNAPTNSALLDIRYGGEPFYPDGYNPQTASPFVIASASEQ
ncbi:MAG: hypothetical protein ACREFF_16025 [Candidatus Udaeobacter sp.]